MTEEKQNGDNGKLTPEEKPAEKTEAQLKEERLGRYNSNPDTFIEISELICAVTRNPKSQLGVSVFIGNSKRSEIDIGWSELSHRISLSLRQMDIQTEIEHSKIMPAKHGMIEGARKIFGRR